ncbi:hypothetical protein CCMSSC00406_0000572 [Pleurotus cornucopiae]|uniref:Uncharacterized protein n=1 Tax=Pleurotus cornucopiae TaxID=5321 RepID=A0ACB7JB03_PLECO|nr:hypothetical protein CCMSSC00406_0000572 [Pleurotus cornucopiae]
MRLSMLYFALATSLSVLASILPSSKDRVVNLGYARYLGKQTYPNTNAFLGIPYAEPPVGRRRFRAPAPLNTHRVSLETRGNVVDATNNPAPCIPGQHRLDDAGNRVGDEDCLKVNIWAPVGAKKGDNLPVLFYIHGGGYIDGTPAHWPFDEWVDRNPNVVIVSVSYRLAVFGFLATPTFDDPLYGDLNAGFKDQIEALNWVKKFINNFGGDPNQITINGQSAGGNSVMLHLVSHQPNKHFNRAIAQSTWRAPMAFPQQMEVILFWQSLSTIRSTILATMGCLRSVDAFRLLAAYHSVATNHTGSHPINTQLAPVLDGQLFTEYPTESFLAGRFTKVPLIVGATTNDSVGPYTSHSSLRGNWPRLTDQDIEDIFALYPAEDFQSEEHRIRRVVGDSQFRCSRVLMGSASSIQPKAWTYRYDQTEPNSPYNSGPNYVGHSSENYILFKSATTNPRGPVKFTPVETAFSEELVSYWLSFVRTGDPNTQKLGHSPTWPAYTTAGRERMVLRQNPKNETTRSGIFVETEPQKEREVCEYIYTNKYVNQQC